MSRITHCLAGSVLVLGLVAPGVTLAAGADSWLMKMQQAVRDTNYQGTFVYRQGDQMEVMQIAHSAHGGRVNERLMSLNGAAREIIRRDDEVICYLPDQNAVMEGHGEGKESRFPSILPEQVARLDNNYRLSLGGQERIAGRMTRMLSIVPRDAFRYGYHLWLDTATGLLLKADLVDQGGQVIEQFMFTSVVIGKPIPAINLKSRYSGKGMVWHRPASEKPVPESKKLWHADRLPDGFSLSSRMLRNLPGKKQPVAHLVYSDGLAAVSVFIERGNNGNGSPDHTTSSMGAAHAWRARVNGHQVTVVGEVPAQTVSMIGASVNQK